MTIEHFNYFEDSGSRIQVVDPITGQTKVGYITGFPTQSSWYYLESLWPDNVWDLYPVTSITWSDYLQKFLVGSLGFDYGDPALPIYVADVIDKERLAWVTASLAANDPYRFVKDIVCSNELERCVAITYQYNVVGIDTYTTSSILYSDNGYEWYTSSFSKIARDIGSADKTIKDMVWSPTTNTFVGLGRSSSLQGVDIYERQYIVTSSNGIDWDFTVISESLNQNLFYDKIAWSPTHNKFVLYGYPSSFNLSTVSASVYTSSTGVSGSWGLASVHSFYGPEFASNKSLNGLNQLVEYNGTMLGVGYSYYNTVTLITSSNLIDWTSIDTDHNSMFTIQYVPGKNKYFASGVSGSTINSPIRTIATSSNLTDWGTLVLDDRLSDGSGNVHSVEWSTDSSNSIAITGQIPYWFYSTGSNNQYIYYRIDDTPVAYVGFQNELPNTTLSTPLTPWTSSIQDSNGTWYPFNFDSAVSWIEFDMGIGANPNINDDQYIPTSSYGIIIDSQSIASFDVGYYGTFTEDVEIGGIRYLQEISQNPGEEYSLYNYGYYETSTLSTIFNTATSSYSAALKANGRDYVYIYYGISGNNYMGESVGMILNLNSGIVEYFEDTTNWDAPGSYNMAGSTQLRFVEGPTLTSEPDNYWRLQFKVAIDRSTITRSGSLTIT